jgi:hypothetical protein
VPRALIGNKQSGETYEIRPFLKSSNSNGNVLTILTFKTPLLHLNIALNVQLEDVPGPFYECPDF